LCKHELVAASELGTALPLYEIKAALFKALGHPSRVRILELLAERDMSVAELLPEVGIESSNLSQQLAVLRRQGLVTGIRSGSRVLYSLADPGVAELLAAARSLLIRRLTFAADVLADLRAEPERTERRPEGNRPATPGGP
jgi:DNA-binding transcriptional ArsR family regulator